MGNDYDQHAEHQLHSEYRAMSYCRWSSDNWRCDLYCFEDSEGFTIHVAGNRVPEPIPPAPDWGLLRTDVARFEREHDALMEYLATTERIPLDLPHAGETFHEPDLKSFRERLVQLRQLGYKFPDYVLKDVDQEISMAESEKPV